MRKKMSVKKLPQDVQSLLNSSSHINCYTIAIEELVYNSIDAEATSIAVRVNFGNRSIQVVDNGSGILKCDMRNIGKRYMTSKCPNISTLKSVSNQYGYRGEALANIVNISEKVMVTSRHESNTDTWLKIFCSGDVSSAGISETSNRPSKGTTININGFLHNLAVPRKNINEIKEMQSIKKFLEQLSLVHNDISLSLRDDARNDIVFKMQKSNDIYKKLKEYYDIEKENIQELSVEKDKYKLVAYIGKEDDDTNCKHHIYLNKRHLQNCKLHKIMDDFLSTYTLTKYRDDIVSKTHKNKYNINTSSKNKIPFYVILFTCPYEVYDFTQISKQPLLEFRNWESVTKLFEKLVKFYVGDINLKEVRKPEVTKNVNTEHDTRDQVNKIMNKVLGACGKISQVQRGVKGKIAKRKKKNIKQNLEKIVSPLKVTRKNKLNYECTNFIENVIRSNQKECLEDAEVIKTPVLTNKLSKDSTPKVIMNKIDKLNSDQLKRHPRIKRTIERKHIDVTMTFKRHVNNINTKKYIKSNIDNKIKETKKYFNEKLNERKPCRALLKNATNGNTYKSFVDTLHKLNKLDENIDKYLEKSKNNIKEYKSRDDLIHTVIKDVERKENNKRFKKKSIVNFSTSNINNIVHSNKFSLKQHLIIPPNDNLKYFDFCKNTKNKLTAQNIYMDNILRDKNLFCDDKTLSTHVYDKSKRSCNTLIENFNTPIQCNYPRFSHRTIKNRASYRINFMESRIHNKFGNILKNLMCSLSAENNPLVFYENCHESESPFIGKNQNSEIIDHNKIFHRYDHYSYMPIKISSSTQNNSFKWDHNIICDSTNVSTYNLPNPKNEVILIDPLEMCEVTMKSYDLFDDDSDINLKKCDKNKLPSYEGINATYKINNSPLDVSNNKQNSEHSLYGEERISSNIENSNIEISYYRKPSEEDNVNEHTDGNGIDIVKEHNVSLQINVPSQLSITNNYIGNKIPPTQPSIIQELSCIEDTNTFNHNQANISQEISSQHVEVCNLDGIAQNHKSANLVMETTFINDDHVMNLQKGTGMTIESKLIEDVKTFTFKDRLRFIPKGLSPIYDNCNTKTDTINSKNNYDNFHDTLYNEFQRNIQTGLEVFEATVQNVNEVTTREIGKACHRIQKSNADIVFDLNSLDYVEVLRQVDNKFIAANIIGKNFHTKNESKYLVLFDQHAVHERINLENNLKVYMHDDKWKPVTLDSFTITLSSEEALYLHNYKDKFLQFGLDWSSKNDREISITSIPEAILGKNIRNVEVIIKAVRKLIQEQVKAIREQNCSVSLYPQSIMELVFSEACRYAIKFGDRLSKSECSELLKSLQKCKTPFQCAHGRPVLAVILELKPTTLSYDVSKEKLEKFVRAI